MGFYPGYRLLKPASRREVSPCENMGVCHCFVMHQCTNKQMLGLNLSLEGSFAIPRDFLFETQDRFSPKRPISDRFDRFWARDHMQAKRKTLISPQSTYFCVLIHAQPAHPTLTPTLAVQSGNQSPTDSS